MLSGVTKLVIAGAGPDGGDVAPDELCPLPVELPLLDAAVVVVVAGLAAVVAVVLAVLSLLDEHPPTRTVTASAKLTTAMRPVDMDRRPAGHVLDTMAVMDFVHMAVPPSLALQSRPRTGAAQPTLRTACSRARVCFER